MNNLTASVVQEERKIDIIVYKSTFEPEINRCNGI